MKHSAKYLILVGIAMLDILLESFYQLFALFRFDSFISSFPEFVKLILNDHLKTEIFSSIKHTIVHLSVHSLLICTCVALLIILFTPKAKTGIFKVVKHVSGAFPAFYGITSFEILILQTQCFVVRYLESRWVWNIFVSEHSMFNLLWPIFVFSIVAPLEMRFKIFLEKKFHYKAVVAIGLLHALSSLIFPYIQLFLSMKVFKSTIVKINDEIAPVISHFKNTTIVFLQSKSHHLNITAASFFNRNYFLIEGHHGTDLNDISASLLFESYKFRTFYKIISAISPFVLNMMFAGIVIFLNKRYLKHLHSADINHITIYLVIEEFLNLGFFKFISAPYRVIEKLLISRNDATIKTRLDLSISNSIILKFIEQAIHSHKRICSSPLSILFSCESNTLRRVENVLKK